MNVSCHTKLDQQANLFGIHYSAFKIHHSYTWGMDLSGSEQGAGGVGGLLSVNDGTATYYPTYDGNGNVSEKHRRLVGVLDRSKATCPAGVNGRGAVVNQYLDSTGAVKAHFEYDAFGNTTVSTGTKKADFAHRFSTKLIDTETSLYYYGYRYYDPATGRWPSRDPIEEDGGLNIYALVNNDGVNSWDYLGMAQQYRFLSRGGYGRTTITLKAPTCSSDCTLSKGVQNSVVTVNQTATYKVFKFSDRAVYTATCTRLKAGKDLTQAHEDVHVANFATIISGLNTTYSKKYANAALCTKAKTDWDSAWTTKNTAEQSHDQTATPKPPIPTPQTFYAENRAGKCTFVKDGP